MQGKVKINTERAQEDVTQIDDIITKMRDNMETLDRAIKATIPDGIETTWSTTVRENWEGYYTGDVPTTLEEMKLSADNIKRIVEQTTQYDQEQ